MKQKEYKKPWWMWTIISVVCISTFIEWGFFGLFFMAIWVACGDKCVKWSNKINKSNNWAYFIGFILGLIGLLGYYIYFKHCKKKIKVKQ